MRRVASRARNIGAGVLRAFGRRGRSGNLSAAATAGGGSSGNS